MYSTYRSNAYTRTDPSSLDTAISRRSSPARAGRHAICVTALSGVILQRIQSVTQQAQCGGGGGDEPIVQPAHQLDLPGVFHARRIQPQRAALLPNRQPRLPVHRPPQITHCRDWHLELQCAHALVGLRPALPHLDTLVSARGGKRTTARHPPRAQHHPRMRFIPALDELPHRRAVLEHGPRAVAPDTQQVPRVIAERQCCDGQRVSGQAWLAFTPPVGLEESDHGVFGGAGFGRGGDGAAVRGGSERGDLVAVAVELLVFGPERVAAEVVLEGRVRESV